MGITIATFRRYIKPTGTVEDLKALTIEQATVVYKRHYWDAVMGDDLPAGLDYALTDFKVMSGAAVRIFQGILKVPADGLVGPITLAAVEKWDTAKLIKRLGRERLGYYQSLPAWPHFKNGWTRRVEECTATAVKWAEEAPKPEQSGNWFTRKRWRLW